MKDGGASLSTQRKEADLILATIRQFISIEIDGKSAITTMKSGGSPNWRQMEWIGFWFEHFAKTQLAPTLGVAAGPSFGRTSFDLILNNVWDLKVHPTNSGSQVLILNDQEAVDACVDSQGGLGFIVVLGQATYDETGSFKIWHDELKGGRSRYEETRISRGAPSRRRKISFRPTSILALYFASQESLQRGLREGWLGYFQSGMRNSNGLPRRAKYKIDLDRVPSDLVVSRTHL